MERETSPSTAFAGYGTNPRQLYCVLAAAPVYAWMDKLLDAIESCARCGWWSNRIMTSDYEQFRGALAELHVAEHFLLRGAQIEPEPAVGAGRADLRVRLDGLEVVIEMIAPIEWGR